jgi:hypothetical protein
MGKQNVVDRLKWSVYEVSRSNRMLEAYMLIGIAALLLGWLSKSFALLLVGVGCTVIWTSALALWFVMSKDVRKAFEEAWAAKG